MEASAGIEINNSTISIYMDCKTLTCHHCHGEFNVSYKGWSLRRSRNRLYGIKIFCSRECRDAFHGTIRTVRSSCSNCGADVYKINAEKLKSKSGNDFCSRSCATTYNNIHKTRGIRRSKLEAWLETELSTMYSFEIHFNRRDAINSELDIYIPSLKLAFELNGIFHYEPIFGESKLGQIQNNDDRKFQACIEKGIELCIIDTSGQKYFKESTSRKYLDIIRSVLETKGGIEPPSSVSETDVIPLYHKAN